MCVIVLCGGGGVVRCVGVVLVLCGCGVGCLCFSLVFPFILFIISLALSLSVFSVFPSSLSSLLSSLFPSRQQTLHKSTDQQTWRPIGRHGLWLRR